MKQVLGKHATRTQSVLHRFQLCGKWTVEILRVEHSIFGLLLNDLASSPRTKRNSRRVLSLSSTRLLDCAQA